MLAHHGGAIGRRHARKHLGWALDAAAETARASEALLKAYRARVLTAEDPAAVRRHLADAFADFGSLAAANAASTWPLSRSARGPGGEDGRMSRHEPMPTLPSGAADAVLDALPHPVIMVAADGKIANANVAAESFFEASVPLLRRHLLRDLVPFGSPLLALDRAGARARRGGQRIQGRSRHAAQSRRAPGRPACRAAAGAAGPRGRHAAGAHHRRQDGPPAHPSRRRALGHRARRHAGARDQESAVRHPRRGAAARAIGRRRRPHA